MNNKDIINYLRENKDILNIKGIGKAAGFPGLWAAVTGKLDGKGYPATFPEKYVKPVADQIKRLSIGTVISQK